MSRFDYVKYDGAAVSIQEALKKAIIEVEEKINIAIESPRAKALALTRLEEAYMWIGKGIRDDQIARDAATLEQRSAILSDKNKGLQQRYEVKKLSNPTKKLNCIVLEFDDPLQRVGIAAFAEVAKKAGYNELHRDLMKKIMEYE